MSLAAPKPGEGGSLSTLAARANGDAAQNNPACPIVLRNVRRVGELTEIALPNLHIQRKTGLTTFIRFGCSLFRILINPVNPVLVMELEGIDHVALSVRDVERSAQWYIDVLGFERLHPGMWNGIPTFIGKGTTGIALFPP